MRIVARPLQDDGWEISTVATSSPARAQELGWKVRRPSYPGDGVSEDDRRPVSIRRDAAFVSRFWMAVGGRWHPSSLDASFGCRKETDMRVLAGLLTSSCAAWFGRNVAGTSIGSDRSRGTWTFAGLNDAANRIGSGVLNAGARRGDRIGVLGYNTPEVLQAWLGFREARSGADRTAQPLEYGCARLSLEPR